MAINLGNRKSVLAMRLLDISTGQETTLFEREGSRCHFHDDIYFDHFIITLRVDWGDLRNTDPVLDADIYESIAGQKGRKLRNGPWHHTTKNFVPEENLSVYEFAFQKLRLRLSARITFGLGVGIDAILVDSDGNEGET